MNVTNIWKNNIKFIALEGLDGSGKSSVVKLYTSFLKILNYKVLMFSPSDIVKTGIIENYIYTIPNEIMTNIINARENVLNNINILKNGNRDISIYNKLAYSYLEFMEAYSVVIEKHIEQGYIVIADRWDLSTLAYNMGSDGDIEKDFLNKSIKILKPDAYIFLDIDHKECYNRINKRDNGNIDKSFETLAKLQRTYESYLYILEKNNRFKNTIKIPKTIDTVQTIQIIIQKLKEI